MDNYNLTISDLSILIVEPSTVQAKIIHNLFQDAQVNNVQIAHNGTQAQEVMSEHQPDLIVSALYLPDMTGTELVLSMRNNEALENIPFMLISSENDNNRLAAVQQSGVSGICDKPFEPDTVKAYLKNIMAEISI